MPLTMDELDNATQRFLAGQTTPEAEGARYSLSDLADTLRMTRGKLQEILESWSQQQLQTRPPVGSTSANGEDNWSATEAVTHLLATQNWYRMNMGRILGARRQFESMPRGLGDLASSDVPKGELARRLRSETEEFLTEIAAIPADADLSATRESHFFGPLSLRGWVYLALTHDAMHLRQIERLRSYPNFPA
jgi:hypothetical protein